MIHKESFQELLRLFPGEKFRMHQYVQTRLDSLNHKRSPQLKRRMRTASVSMRQGDELGDHRSLNDLGGDQDDSASDPFTILQKKKYNQELTKDEVQSMPQLRQKYGKTDETLRSIATLKKKVEQLEYQWLNHLEAETTNKQTLAKMKTLDSDKVCQEEVVLDMDDIEFQTG